MWGGYASADELKGRNALEFIHPSYHEKAVQFVRE